MHTNELTDGQRQILASQLKTLRDRSNTPEAMGWAISNYVLSEGAMRGTVNGDHLEIPMTITVSLPRQHEIDVTSAVDSATDEEIGIGVIIDCVKTCTVVLGVELFCREDCHESAVTVHH